MNNKIQLFQNQQVRTIWDSDNEEWLLSVVDVVRILTDQPNHQAARNYWKVLKSRIVNESGQPVTKCNQLPNIFA